jgi:hypothetical protein
MIDPWHTQCAYRPLYPSTALSIRPVALHTRHDVRYARRIKQKTGNSNVNKDRRKRINNVLARLAGCREELREIYDEEAEALDAMPESIQSSDRGEDSQAAIGSLGEAIEALEEIDGCFLPETENSPDTPRGPSPVACSAIGTNPLKPGEHAQVPSPPPAA